MANDCDIVTNINIATTDSLRVRSEILPVKLLKDNLSESFDVKEHINSDFAFYHISKTTRFKNCRHEDEFPFKETDLLGDNYLNCKRGHP